MSVVEIEYCVPCDFRERALVVRQAIINALEDSLEEVRLVMGDHGVFEIRVDETVVFEKETDEFDVDQIVRDVRPAL